MGVVGHSPASGREAWPVSLQSMDSQGDRDATWGLARRESPLCVAGNKLPGGPFHVHQEGKHASAPGLLWPFGFWTFQCSAD